MTGIFITGSLQEHDDMFRCEYLGYVPLTQDTPAERLAKVYHLRTEEFDKKHCSGRTQRGEIVPNNTNEYLASTRHAAMVLQEVRCDAHKQGVSYKELLDAIQDARNSFL